MVIFMRSSTNRTLQLVVLSITTSAILAIALLAILYLRGAPNREMRVWNDKLIEKLELAKMTPPETVNRADWEWIVGWTQVAIPNCFYGPNHILDTERYFRFRERLGNMAPDDIDLVTISWIWDQLAAICSNGKVYVNRFRPIEPFGTEQRQSIN